MAKGKTYLCLSPLEKKTKNSSDGFPVKSTGKNKLFLGQWTKRNPFFVRSKAAESSMTLLLRYSSMRLVLRRGAAPAETSRDADLPTNPKGPLFWFGHPLSSWGGCDPSICGSDSTPFAGFPLEGLEPQKGPPWRYPSILRLGWPRRELSCRIPKKHLSKEGTETHFRSSQ